MKAKKTVQRRVAEKIAQAESIKVKSAQRRIQRAAKAGKPVTAPENLSSYYKRLFREVVREKKAAPRPAPRPRPVPAPAPEFFPDLRVDFDFSGVELFKMKGRFKLGSGKSKDIRDREIKDLVDSEQINEILNAETFGEAAAIFAEKVGYIADVLAIEYFEFRGKKYFPSSFE